MSTRLSSAEYKRVLRCGSRVSRNGILLVSAPSTEGAQVGFVVSKAVGNAVCRNRFRRVVREWFRHHSSGLPSAIFVIVAKAPISTFSNKAIRDNLGKLFGGVGGKKKE